MKTATILSHVGVLLIGAFTGYLIAKNSLDPKAPLAETKTELPADTTEGTETDESETITEETTPTGDLCFAGEDKLARQLSLFSEEIEKKKLWYDNDHPDAYLNNSGIFHRVVEFVKSKCEQYDYPDREIRGPAKIAHWYAERSNLTPFTSQDDAVSRRNLIKPGTVLFFGKSGQTYNDLTIPKVAVDGDAKIVNHMGVVTEVVKDAKGDVKGYVMLHGRGDGKFAQRTHYHNINPAGFGMPPLGNYNQQLVAIANIRTPKTNARVTIAPPPDPPSPSTDPGSVPVAVTPEPLPTLDPAPVVPTKSPDNSALACFGFDFRSYFYENIAKVLEARKIGYKVGEHADCSGIVYRVCNMVSDKMGGDCAGDMMLPCADGYKDSRSLAKWYYDNGNLEVVTDPKKTGDKIKVGSVMFFGQNNQHYNKNVTLAELMSGPKRIQHVGVVAKVDRDEEGNVVSYHLFHGHGKPGTPADITRPSLNKNQTLRNNRMAFSYWKQQWVAIAPNILTLK